MIRRSVVLRPVTMAALTTVLGMLPLLKDVFYVGMSVTIMGGLTFGTVLTLVVIPVLYSVFFRIRSGKAPAPAGEEFIHAGKWRLHEKPSH